MAQTNQKALHVLGVLSVFLLVIMKSHAFEFKVGGPSGTWAIPSDPKAAPYNQWAEKNRFQIGDTLLFVYDADEDSVLHVTHDDYTNCNTESPLEKFTDGHTLLSFNQSGPYYFISGVADHCHRNEKLVVIVMADRSIHKNSNQQLLPPSPPPAAEEPPSPPPTTSDEPSPPKKNTATTVDSVLGTVAAFVGLSAVLAM